LSELRPSRYAAKASNNKVIKAGRELGIVMKLALRLVNPLRPLELSRALGVITCAASASALTGFEQQLNHVVAGAISDCVGAQILQFVPLLAAMSTGGSDTGSIAAQVAVALIAGALFAMFRGLLSSMGSKRSRTNAQA